MMVRQDGIVDFMISESISLFWGIQASSETRLRIRRSQSLRHKSTKNNITYGMEGKRDGTRHRKRVRRWIFCLEVSFQCHWGGLVQIAPYLGAFKRQPTLKSISERRKADTATLP